MEQWKDVAGYEGLYKVSTEGRVYSTRNDKIICQSIARGGYPTIQLNLKGVPKKYFIHRLVATTFIPNPKKLPIINHKDENPSNNRAENLEWCTYKYNSNYGTIKQRRVANTNYRRGADSPNSRRVYQFDLQGSLIAEYVSCAEAAQKTGFSHKSISKGCTGRLKVYKGFVWSYDGTFKLEPKKRVPRRGAVLMFDTEHNLLKRYEYLRQVEQDGFNSECVGRCCRGLYKSYRGHIWKYAE